jgi:mono/diheme cytochrome c family protein
MITMTRISFRATLVAAGLFAVVGCSKSSSSGGGGAAAPGPGAAEAKEIFTTRCSTCHGPEGMGNGPAGAALNPHPRNFHDKDWQKSVTDDHIIQIIKEGGAAVGKSPAMPPNPDLVSKPEVVSALKDIVRGFGKE